MKKIYSIFYFLFLITALKAQNFEKAVKFNGTSDYITVPNASNSLETANFTFECWAKRATSVSQYGKDRLFMSINSNGWGVFIEANKLKITKVGVSEASSVGSIADTLWHHLAVSFNGTEDTVRFYIDGALDSKSKFNYSFSSTGSYSIASRGTGEFFAGEIEEMRIWSVVRNDYDISTNKCTILSGNETGLNRYYNFNDGSGTTVTDASLNAQHGTITSGTTLWVNSSLTCTNSLNEKDLTIIKLYPNPAKEYISIENSINNKPYTLSIYNLYGSIVYSQEISSDNSKISVTDFVPGVYFVKTQNQVVKFIKQ